MGKKSAFEFDLRVLDTKEGLNILDAEHGRRAVSPKDLAYKLIHRRDVLILLDSCGSKAYREFIKESVSNLKTHKLFVAANPRPGRNPSLCRGYKGSTARLHVFNATFGQVSCSTANVSLEKGPFAKTIQLHPAWQAVKFLAKNGAWAYGAGQLLWQLCDIRKAVDTSLKRAGVGDLLSEVVSSHDLFGEGNISFAQVTPWMRKQLALYRGDRQTDFRLFESIIGDGFRDPSFSDDSFAGRIVRRHTKPGQGICHAVNFGLGLIFSEWMAKEFHPDLFESYPLQFGDLNGRAYSEYRSA